MKLIKGKSSDKFMLNMEGVGYITTYESTLPYKLSLKNCQSIERGYDLDELFQREIDELMFTGNLEDSSEYIRGMYKGAKILFELMGDKKFSEEDVRKAMEIARNGSMQEQHNGYGRPTELRFVLDNISSDEIIQSLQQTEWEVEIEMETVLYSANMPKEGESRPPFRPKLDADGCLILKRI